MLLDARQHYQCYDSVKLFVSVNVLSDNSFQPDASMVWLLSIFLTSDNHHYGWLFRNFDTAGEVIGHCS